mmetsp:Transcript_10204/g.24756  ORF Transcript_10204/g.24756 Transcript_10204/m.24756 type:complete len:220 (+) Transcript_10204:809-1468(+)
MGLPEVFPALPLETLAQSGLRCVTTQLVLEFVPPLGRRLKCNVFWRVLAQPPRLPRHLLESSDDLTRTVDECVQGQEELGGEGVFLPGPDLDDTCKHLVLEPYPRPHSLLLDDARVPRGDALVNVPRQALQPAAHGAPDPLGLGPEQRDQLVVRLGVAVRRLVGDQARAGDGSVHQLKEGEDVLRLDLDEGVVVFEVGVCPAVPVWLRPRLLEQLLLRV